MSKENFDDYSRQLKSLRESLEKIKNHEDDFSSIDDISVELTALEDKMISNTPGGGSSNSREFDLNKKIEKLQRRLDETVKKYERSYETTRKLLYEKESKLDSVRLLSAEEIQNILTSYSEQLLNENSYSCFLRKLIALQRGLLENYQELLLQANSDSMAIDREEDRVDLGEINLTYFSSPVVASDKFRKICLTNKFVKKIRDSVLLMPEKIVATKKAVDYRPNSAPSDMTEDGSVNDNISNSLVDQMLRYYMDNANLEVSASKSGLTK